MADKLIPAVDMPAIPDTVRAPEGLDLDPYLRVLRWFLKEGEQLRNIAFLFEIDEKEKSDVMLAFLLKKRVNGAWNALAPGKAGAIADKLTSSTLVAVTDLRIVTATPKTLLNLGELGTSYSLDEVKHVRPTGDHDEPVRPTITITTKRSIIRWMFPARAYQESIVALESAIVDGNSRRAETEAIIDAAELTAN